MLLTITTTHTPATDLGYLLHKHPDRCQSFPMTFGQATVFYSEASADRCTAVLLLEIDPVSLVRGKSKSGSQGTLEQYVNDRPYVASSFLSVAIAKVFSTALNGRCKDLSELAETAISLTVSLPVWWKDLTAKGGEGMVVKPMQFISQTHKGLVQPAVKCRGQEYLRIIYGPEYSMPENLERLRQRGLSFKRSLALREFALGIEALERFVAHAPLRQVHECVFGVLALESEPVDPRL